MCPATVVVAKTVRNLAWKLCPIGMFLGLEILPESWNFLNVET